MIDARDEGACRDGRGWLSRRGFVGASLGVAVTGMLAGRRVTADESDVVAFYVVSDTHFLADEDAPDRLVASSAACTARFIERLNALAGTEIPENAGGGVVRPPRFVIHAGDIIDTGDKSGRVHEAMQATEIAAFEAAMGLTGRDGAIDVPVYELHGNHDGPAGKGPLIDRIAARTRRRPGLTNASANGLHYSWDAGDVHFVNLGIVVGTVPGIARRRRYAPLESLDFLVADLAEHVGTSGRPVIVSHHVDIARYTPPVPPDAPFAAKEWDPADVGGFHAALAGYRVAAIFHGHTHGRAVWRWDGTSVMPAPERFREGEGDDGERPVFDVFNCDNSSTPKGGQQAFFYVEWSPAGLVVREHATKDAWQTAFWTPLVWRRDATAVGAT
jgi:cytolysin (calcineurin-like family phosphatase)